MPSLIDTSGRYTIGEHAFTCPAIPGGLYLVVTPIGNLNDITLRALATLAAADLVLCEDTRITARLLQRYQITTRMKTYHDHNAAKQRPGIVKLLTDGGAIALVSDAGTPLVSDPGYKLVRACLDEGIEVHMIPGVSAPVMALALSGLPSDRFQFCGFLPAKRVARRRMLGDLKVTEATLIFFDSAQRIAASLADVNEVLGDREVAIGRELTKLHEEVMRGTPAALLADIAGRASLKGEVTLVVAPPARHQATADSEAVRTALKEALRDLPAGRAAAETARRFGLPRKALYEQALTLKAQDRQ